MFLFKVPALPLSAVVQMIQSVLQAVLTMSSLTADKATIFSILQAARELHLPAVQLILIHLFSAVAQFLQQSQTLKLQIKFLCQLLLQATKLTQIILNLATLHLLLVQRLKHLYSAPITM